MKLHRLRIRNFRCYKDEIAFDFDEMTAFIGKNDVGKSSVLEALEIFFNNSLVVCEREDLNINADNNQIEITCVFGEFPEEIIIDAAAPTSLQNEYLLNNNNKLEIKKVFVATVAKPKEKIYIICNHPSVNSANDLLDLKRPELKTRANQLGIPTANYNGNINSSIRQAIWRSFDDLQLTQKELLVDKEDTKKVYEQNSINGHFEAVPVTAGDVEIERVSCAKTLASAFALGYDTKPGTRPIYRYASGWIQETDGLDVSVGADGTVAIINGSGKPMIRNSKKSTWDNVGKSSPSLVRIIVESHMLMWGIDLDGVVWSFDKNIWKKITKKDGKPVIGFVSGGAKSSGLLLLIASSGDAYCRSILPKNIKMDTTKKVKTLGQIRKERIKREQ